MQATSDSLGRLTRARDPVALATGAVAILGLSPTLRRTRLGAAHAPDLAWYRDHVFRGDEVPEVTKDP